MKNPLPGLMTACKQNPVYVILGPTASGKTALASALAVHPLWKEKNDSYPAEIISADSRQVYKGMDIGTGKDIDEYCPDGIQIPYHLIDILDAGEMYNVYMFQQDFDRVLFDINQRKAVPILCGGTGMYLEAALGSRSLQEVPYDIVLRENLADWKDACLIAYLRELKPKQHNTTDTESRERCLRAIEIALFEEKHPSEPRKTPETHIFGIYFQAQDLRKRIYRRLTERLKNGLIEEVESLRSSGVRDEALIYYGLEYRFICEHLQGKTTRSEMTRLLFYAICQFAKRQRTWFRKMEKEGYQIQWIPGDWPLEKKRDFIVERIS